MEAEGGRRFSFVFISYIVFIGSGFNAGVKQDPPMDPDSRSPSALVRISLPGFGATLS